MNSSKFKKKRKKVLFLATHLADGGVQRVVANVVNNLNIKNLNLVLYENKINYDCNVKKIILNSPPGDNYFNKLFKFISRVRQLRKIKKEQNVTHTISFADGPNLVNIFSKVNDKIIISIHSAKTLVQEKNSIARKIYYFLYKSLYKKADTIICVSYGTKEDIINNFNVSESRVKIIYNAVNIDNIEKKCNEPLQKKYEKIFLSPSIINMGRLTRAKGQWHLIRVFSEIRKTYSEIKLIILGSGELKNYLVNLSKLSGLNVYSVWGDNDAKVIEENDIFFLGFQKNPFNLINASNIFTFSSLFEGFGLSLLEAMVCGKLVVSADYGSGSSREIIAPRTDIKERTNIPEFAEYGVLMPQFNGIMYKTDRDITKIEKTWSETLIKLLTNKNIQNRYSNLSKKRANYFSVKKIIKQWEYILR